MTDFCPFSLLLYKINKRDNTRVMLWIGPSFYPPKKLMLFLKLSLDQNSIVIHLKFNGNFKSYISFGMIKRGK
jgi:hypothetical protein